MKLVRSKCLTAAMLVFAMLLSVPVAAYASSGGGHVVERPGGGHQIGGDDDIPEGDAYFRTALMYTSGETVVYREDTFSLIGDGNFTVRTAKVRLSGLPGYYGIIPYIFSDCPFLISSHAYVQRNNEKGDITVYTDNKPLNREAEEIILDDNSACYYLHYSIGIWGTKDCTDFTLSAPGVMEFIDDVDLNVILPTVDTSKDNGGLDSGSGSGSDSGDGGGSGSGDGSGSGNGDDSGGDSGDGGGKLPDFDLDWSNIFTLIYSILKALIDFIAFCLNMLVEFAALLLEQVGQFSSLIGAVFTFLPEEFITMILTGITVIVLMGIVRR